MNYDSSMPDNVYMNDPSAVDPTTSAAMTGAASVFFILFMLFICLAAYVINAILLARIFKKAGVEQWKAWVPVYNMWVLLELGDQKGFWAVLMLVPIVNIVSAVFMYIAMYRIGLKFGKDGAFVLLAIFLPLVWYVWLAVDKSTWNGTKPAVAATAPAQPVVPNSPADQAPSDEDDEPTAPTPPKNPAA